MSALLVSRVISSDHERQQSLVDWLAGCMHTRHFFFGSSGLPSESRKLP